MAEIVVKLFLLVFLFMCVPVYPYLFEIVLVSGFIKCVRVCVCECL